MAEIISKEEIKKKYNRKENNTNCDDNITIQKKRVVGYCRVSTNKDEQQDSFENQKNHFEYLAEKNSDWELVNIYQDYGISGGTIDKREGFQMMLNDAYKGKFDLIIVKNLSRFARNVIDTLNAVKNLSEHKVYVLFEEEHIYTEQMINTMVLTFLSAICEQELINTSNHVKQSFKNKMKENKLVGYHRCLGYTCDYDQNTMTVVPDEAKIVEFIFKRYLEGVGCYRIARELDEKGIKTMRGNSRWNESVVRDILKNEVYVGHVIQGKTITVDPLTHRRLENKGEQEMYKISNHHEAIISEADFEKVQSILHDRRTNLTSADSMQVDRKTRRINTKMYTFSSMIYCGFCGDMYTHRKLYAGTKNEKEAWACCTAYKKGKKHCENSKTIDQNIIEKAFVEAFNKFTCGHIDVIEDYLKIAEKALNATEDYNRLTELNNKIVKAKTDNEKILDIILNNTSFDEKMLNDRIASNNDCINKSEQEINQLTIKLNNTQSSEERLRDFKKVISTCSSLTDFNKDIFLAVVEKVIIGKIDEEGNKNPYDITFIFKTGSEITESGTLFINKKEKEKMYPNHCNSTCRDSSTAH